MYVCIYSQNIFLRFCYRYLCASSVVDKVAVQSDMYMVSSVEIMHRNTVLSVSFVIASWSMQ